MNRAFLPAVLIVALTGCQQDTPPGDSQVGEAPAATAAAATPDPATATATAAPSSSQAPAEGALLDPNQATREELTAIPNLNEQVADAIIAGRPYNDMLAVDRVLANHLSENQREAVYGRLWKPLDLNKASGEEILLIPGVGPRMRHEFEEYRPYRAVEQFRREIGKYVNQQEVARLERYVSIR